MATYDLIERLNTTFREIEQALLTLTGQLQDCRLLAARVFSLPEVAKGAEHDPLNTIEVTQHIGKAALEMTLQHFRRLSSISSPKIAAVRPPFACPASSACKRMPQRVKELRRRLRISIR